MPVYAEPSGDYRAKSGLVSAYLELSKFRLSLLVLLTTAVGYVLAAGGIDWLRFSITLVGTALAAFGANAFNQVLEKDRDRRMLRTRTRPLPSGAISPRAAVAYALAVGLGGPLLLAVAVDLWAGALALGCALLYVVVYTPMKVRSSLNTLVGAVVGAIPPLIGWVAASGELAGGAWVLAAILFVWQIPHFLALAWLYREDYERGGFRMLPMGDRGGEMTCQAVVLYSLALVPVTLMLTGVGAAGIWYASGAVLLSSALIALAVRLYGVRSDANARRVFLASVIYLPLLLGLMVVDGGV